MRHCPPALRGTVCRDLHMGSQRSPENRDVSVRALCLPGAQTPIGPASHVDFACVCVTFPVCEHFSLGSHGFCQALQCPVRKRGVVTSRWRHSGTCRRPLPVRLAHQAEPLAAVMAATGRRSDSVIPCTFIRWHSAVGSNVPFSSICSFACFISVWTHDPYRFTRNYHLVLRYSC